MENNLHFQDSNSSYTPPPPPPPPPPPTSGGSGNYGQTTGKASSAAIWALVLGIASYLCSLGLITGIPAWIIGKKEINAINAGQSDPAGKTISQVGMWLGIISVILTILMIIIGIFFIILGGFATYINN